jgi:hypothetical protein
MPDFEEMKRILESIMENQLPLTEEQKATFQGDANDMQVIWKAKPRVIDSKGTSIFDFCAWLSPPESGDIRIIPTRRVFPKWDDGKP